MRCTHSSFLVQTSNSKTCRGTWCPPMRRLQLALLLLMEMSQCLFHWDRSPHTCIGHQPGEPPSTGLLLSSFCLYLCLYRLPILCLRRHHQSDPAKLAECLHLLHLCLLPCLSSEHTKCHLAPKPC